MPSEIKPCPSCGGGSTIATDANRRAFFVACTGSCMMEGPYTEARDEAIAKWNRLHMLPEGKPGTWMERAHEYTEACLTACEGLNPEALGKLVGAVEESKRVDDARYRDAGKRWRHSVEAIYFALAKLKGGE